MKKTVFIIFLTVLITVFVQGQTTWTNPTTRSGEWTTYGTGDPYIMKYRGVYYLYCSSKDGNNGIKCWSTKDFVTWSGVNDCVFNPTGSITASDLRGAYAPEVYYWNGKFYMYTSPAGNGHYVSESNSPTGPFTIVSGTTNFGKGIDGSVFIEDNGQWYFYHTGSSLSSCPMTSPTSLGSSSGLGISVSGGWTEGPTVIKRNGVYYLIYTGNHITSRGYRIDYAMSTSSPNSGYTARAGQNPILINTEGKVGAGTSTTSNPVLITEDAEHAGLGHGSIFIGPDLDTYYYVYHNLNYRSATGGHRRKANFDRVAWNGDKLMLLGPTTWAQQGFRLADMSDFFDRATLGTGWTTPDGGTWAIVSSDRLVQSQSTGEFKVLSNQSTGADYTAEFSIKEESGNTGTVRFGAVFGYTDESNYGVVVLNSNPTNRLEVNFKQNGTWGTSTFYTLPAGYSLSAWHSLRIEKSGTTYKFFIDNMQKATITNTLGGGKIGYITSSCQAGFGYIAFSNSVNGSGMFDVYKPIPGIMSAVHYNTGGEGVAYHTLTLGNAGGGYIRNDNVDISACSEGGFAINSQADEWYKYNVNVATAGLYNLGLRYSSTEATTVRIWHGDTDLTGIITLPITAAQSNWRTTTIKNLSLPAGYQTLKIETVSGKYNFYEMRFVQTDPSITTLSDDFNTSFNSNWNYADGSTTTTPVSTWSINSGEAVLDGYGKRTMGSKGLTDYTVQVDVTYTRNFNAGLIFRVNNPSMGDNGHTQPAASRIGSDFLQGYFVGLTSSSVVLGKQNYNWTELATKTGESFALNQKYTLKVEVKGSTIKAYVNNVEKINYTDPNPFISGKAGLRIHDTAARFDNFSITPDASQSVLVTGVHLNKEEISLIYAQRDTLIATVEPNNATNKTVTWSSSNSSIAVVGAATGYVLARNVAGTAIITATTAEGEFKANCVVTVGPLTGIIEVENLLPLQVYPNPTNGELKIKNGELKITDFEIYNTMGQLAMQGALPYTDGACNVSTINVSALPNEVYYLKIGEKTIKFIKQ